MKLKAPKTWQLVLIFVSIVLLAVGGGVLYVYLTDGFKTKDVYPEIEITDSDNVLNNSQYEVTDDFDLVFTTQTEGVNKKGIILSFPSGVAFTRDEENGTISDGVITVPEKVSLDEKVTVSLVKQAYDKNNNLVEDVENYNEEENGKLTYINKGGISNLVITPESNTDYNQKITIAVDVPVLSLDLKFVDVTTGLEYENADGTTIIPEGTNFKAVPVFTPQASAYKYSDDKNSALQNKREKGVYYSLGTNTTGIQFNYSQDNVYFTALEKVSQNNIINAYAFKTAKDEDDFLSQNSSLDGEALYNQALSVLSNSSQGVVGETNLSVIEANVGLFSILQNSADHPYELSVDKLFKILAGNNNPNGGALSATIQDIHGADLSGMIRNIGMRVISATDSTGQDLIGKVDLRGGNERLASNENSYVLINSNVRDLNLAYFELSSSVECEIQLGIVLIVQDEEGNYNIFDEEKILYASVSTHEEDGVEWDTDWVDVEGINLKIIYNNGVPVPAQYNQNLYDVAVVPATNVYQRKVVFAYGDGVEGNVSYSQQGLGTYSYNGGNTKFYPLEGGELVVNHATSFNIVFATVQTNAYNEPIFNEDGTYKLIKTSSPVTVDVEDSLRGINSVEVEVTNGAVWLEGTAPAYAIPSGSNITGDTIGETIKMTIYVESGDEQLFIDEFNNGNITFFASKDENGAGEKITNVFRFGTPVSNGAGTGSVSLNIGIEPNLKFSVEKGENYYLVVEYNNSISTESEVANIGGADRLDYITVYDQQTKTIESGLENKNLTVTQTLKSDGTSSIDITGLEKSSVGLNVLNNYFAEFGEENQKGIKTLDQYDREFKGNYSIASSNPTLVMANDILKTISFGNGSGTATVTIKSGSATITLNFSVTSTGVSSIYVLDQQYTGTSSVSYSYTPTGVGDGSTEIKLKNESGNQNSSSVDQGILTVYVNDGYKYSNDAYTITLAPTFLSEVNSDLWNMISYKTINADGTVSGFSNGTPLSSDSIYSLRLNNHFGRSVTLILNARNANDTLNFTFSLTIQPTAQLTENSLNQVNYGEGITGVDKHTDTNTIGVYAGFGINLNNTSGTDTTIPSGVKNYLLVKNVEWGAVFNDVYYIDSDGSIKTEEENGYIAQINKGVLTFNDVTQPTSYNIKLYAVNMPNVDPLKGNYYGFSIDLSFVVYPNLQIEKPKTTNGTISLLAMAQAGSSYSYTNIFKLSRITTLAQADGSSIGTNDLTNTLKAGGLVGSYKFVDENNNNLEYIKVDMQKNGNISRTEKSLHFDRNTSSKEIVLYCYDNSGNVIASNTFDLTLGIDVETLISKALLTTEDGANAITKALKFDGKKVALITQSSIKVLRNWEYKGDATTGSTTGLTAELLSTANSDFYRVTSTQEEDSYTLSLQSKNQALRYDNNAYIRFNFKSADLEKPFQSDGLDYATWDIPVVLSQIGGDFPGEDNADLYNVINNGVKADAFGGGAYSLLDLAGLTATSEDVTISFSYLKDGAVSTDYSDSLISSLTNGNIVFKNLSTNYSGLVDGKLPMDIQITMLKGDFSHTFILHLFVTPNATLNSVNYPYEEATTEYLSVESSLTVDLEAPHSNGNKRFPDIATPTVEENLTGPLTSSDDNIFTGNILINEKAYSVEYTAETNRLTLSLGETVAKGESGKIIVEGKEYSYALNDSTLTLSLLGLGEATYKIKAFYVDGVEASYDNLVSISGSKLTLTNANNGLDNSTLIVEKSYSNFFGETLEYTFTINSTNVEYFLDIKKANAESADNVDTGNGGWVIDLGRGEEDHEFSITTKQRWENGEESSVLPNEVETILQAPSVVGYSFTLDTTETNPKTLTITVPAFVEADREINLTFVINDGQAEINVKVLIPATVDMQWIDNSSLQGGSEYNAVKKDESNINGMFENIPDAVTITSVIAYEPGNYDVEAIEDVTLADANTGKNYIPANFIDITGTTISVQPIYGESKTATIRVYYSYADENTGYTEKTFNFEPNISIKSQGIGDILAGDTKTIALTQILESSDTKITSDGTYTLKSVNIDENLFESDGIDVVNSGSDPYLRIMPKYVGQNTPARIVFTLTYEKDGYSFTTDNIELTFTIVAAATYDISYPNPFGAVDDLGYESYQKGVSIVFDERTIIIDEQTYSYTYDAEDNKLALTLVTDGDEVKNCDLSQENPSVTINGKTYNVVYSSESNTLTLSQIYTSENDSISLDDKTYSVRVVDSVVTLTRSINGATYNFFGEKADFAENNRITFSDVALTEGDGTISITTTPKSYSDIANDITYSIISFSGFSNSDGVITNSEDIYDLTKWNSKIFEVKSDVTVAEGASVTFGITYKGVTAQYTIYFFTTVISASTNNTINYVTTASGSYENIYADNSDIYEDDTTTTTTNIFAKNRLVELSIVRDGAVAGSLQKIYVRTLGAEDKDDYLDNPLASFVLTQSMIDKGSNIFVDIGILRDKAIASSQISTTDNLLKEGYEFVIGSFNSNGDFVGSTAVSFVRQASRVEYKYRLSNGNTQIINSSSLTIVEEEETSLFDRGEVATFSVKYQIGETTNGEIEYKLKKALDIEAQHAWSESNQTVVEIETNKINHYMLVNEMGIRHPSTGEMLSAENIGEADISLQVVDTLDESWDWNTIGGLPSNISSNEFKYQTTSGDDYLSFTPIKDNDKVYDYYLFGEGTDNNGTYVLLELTYKVSSTTKPFYFVVKLIPDYNVTIGGMQVATAGVVTDGVASNEDNPYNFVPDDKSVFNIATNNDSIISFVRSNWDSSNIAKSLTYTLTEQVSGNGYNEKTNTGKLQINVKGTEGWAQEEKPQGSGQVGGDGQTLYIYKWENASGVSNELRLIPTSIAFGQKLYMLEITNSWGFEIEFYFTLSSPSSQNPVISTAFSDATFTEGEKFDVGVIYDKIVATPVIDEEGTATGKYDLTMQRDILPEDNSGAVKMIVVDNIATWGINETANSVNSNNINSGNDIYDNYMASTASMIYQYVTIESVGFKYLDENSRNAEPDEADDEADYKLITSSDLKTPWQGIDYTGIGEGENPGRFTVPNLPGWYYGTNSSVQVEVHVTLKYQKDGDVETCDISFPATVSRQYNVSTSKNVVIDAQSFNLSEYINVKNNGEDVTSGVTYYDDTLEVTLPAGGQATVTVEMTRESETFEGSKTINNTYQYRPETTYNSLSEILGMTLQPNTDTVKINVTASEDILDSVDFRVRYGNNDIREACLATNGKIISWSTISNDTLYIEDSGRFTNNYAIVNQSYIVGVNSLYYRYNQVYWLTREYYSLDTGLGDSTIRRIDVAEYNSSAEDGDKIQYEGSSGVWTDVVVSDNAIVSPSGKNGNFKIPISAWAEDVIIYQATQNNGQIGNGSKSPLAGLFDSVFDITYTYTPADEGTSATCTFTATDNATFTNISFENGVGTFDMTYEGETTTYEFKTDSNGNLISINGHVVDVANGNEFSSTCLGIGSLGAFDENDSIYFEVTAGEGDVSTAYFDGTYLYTGPGYTINNQQYILVNIYVKASGGPDKAFEKNAYGNDYRLGWFRVILV